jgi:hypothetical protein
MSGISNAEQRLNEFGLYIEEEDFRAVARPGVGGFVLIEPLDDGAHRIVLLVLPGTAPDARARFADWALSRIQRFLEHGPEPDGWQRRQSDGGWQLWAREVEFPPLD